MMIMVIDLKSVNWVPAWWATDPYQMLYSTETGQPVYFVISSGWKAENISHGNGRRDEAAPMLKPILGPTPWRPLECQTRWESSVAESNWRVSEVIVRRRKGCQRSKWSLVVGWVGLGTTWVMASLLGVVTGTSVRRNHFKRWLYSTNDNHRRLPSIKLERWICSFSVLNHSGILNIRCLLHHLLVAGNCISGKHVVFLLLETNMCFHYHRSIKPFDQERFYPKGICLMASGAGLSWKKWLHLGFGMVRSDWEAWSTGTILGITSSLRWPLASSRDSQIVRLDVGECGEMETSTLEKDEPCPLHSWQSLMSRGGGEGGGCGNLARRCITPDLRPTSTTLYYVALEGERNWQAGKRWEGE